MKSDIAEALSECVVLSQFEEHRHGHYVVVVRRLIIGEGDLVAKRMVFEVAHVTRKGRLSKMGRGRRLFGFPRFCGSGGLKLLGWVILHRKLIPSQWIVRYYHCGRGSVQYSGSMYYVGKEVPSY